MSNLSDLLPAGAGGKNVSFTATGNLDNGTVVGLKTDGTVAVLDPDAVGSPADFPSSFAVQLAAACYDPIRDVVHVAYKDNSTQYVTHSAGSISGSTITWGTKSTVSTETPKRIDIAFMESIQFPIVAYCLSSGGQDFKVRSGSGGSGTSMNWNGNLHTVQSGQTRDCYIAYNPSNSDASSAETLVLYTYEPNGYVYMAALETTNGASTSTRLGVTSLAYYSGDQMDTVGLVKVGTGSSFLAVLNRNNYTTNNTGSYAYQIAISSTQINFSTGAVIGTGYGASGTVVDQALTSNTGRMASDGSSNYGVITGSFKEGSSGAQSLRAYVITANGTAVTPTVTGPVDMVPGVTGNLFFGTTTVYDSSASKYVTVTGYGNNSYYGYVLTSSLSGTTFTVDAGAISLQSQNIYYDALTAAYSEHSNNTVIASQQNPQAAYRGVTFSVGSLNIDRFIGITAQAITNGNTGNVTVKGGIATTTAATSTTTFGSAAIFEQATSDTIRSTYDSNSNRVVLAYIDTDNSQKGTAVVGEVSGTNITWGTPVLFYDGSPGTLAITFDSSNNKVVISYTDSADSYKGKARVGTVDPSTNTLTFGSVTEYESSNSQMNSMVFDTTNNKVIIAYQDDADSDKGKAVVGTVSGTSISFPGSIAEFHTGSLSSLCTAYDSTNNRVVCFFRNNSNNNYGTGVVGQVSGDNISFGSASAFNNSDSLFESQAGTFDSVNGNVVVGYRDLGGGSNYGYAIAGTVNPSNNTITFGTPDTFNTGSSIAVNSLFDPSTNKIVFSYSNAFTTGEIVTGSLSGTVFTFDTGAQFNSSGASYNPLTYDNTAQKVVVAYRDAGNSNYGTAKVVSPVGSLGPLTPNTVYYVADDGTISTTSTGLRIGKALSTSSINLEFET